MAHRLLPFLLASLLLTSAEAAPPKTPAELLKAARARHHDVRASGLKAFTARLVIDSHPVPGLGAEEKEASFGYTWTAPDQGKYDFDNVPKAWHGGLQRGLGNLFQELTGTLCFDVAARATETSLQRKGRDLILTGALAKYGPARLRFEARTLKLLDLALPRHKITVVYGLVRVGKTYRIQTRAYTQGGKSSGQIRYGGWRSVNGFLMPTRLKTEGGNEPVEITVHYQTINGKPAELKAVGKASVQARVRSFEADWRRWSAADKVSQLKDLAELDHDLVVTAIGRLGLVDRTAQVRTTAAAALGRMKRKTATAMLVAALERNVGQIQTYQTICWALAQIDDPRAVGPLSDNWWKHREAGKKGVEARCWAVGKIHAKASVDALLNMATVSDKEAIGQYGKLLVSGLVNLTGQNFGGDLGAWKKWWKANRARHTFKGETP